MPIELQCPCGKRLRMNEEAAGQQGKCPVCGAILDIPLPEPVVPPLRPVTSPGR